MWGEKKNICLCARLCESVRVCVRACLRACVRMCVYLNHPDAYDVLSSRHILYVECYIQDCINQ